MPEIWDWLAIHSPDHAYFNYAREDGGIRSIPWSEAVAAMYTASKVIKDRMRTEGAFDNKTVIALLASSGTNQLPWTCNNV